TFRLHCLDHASELLVALEAGVIAVHAVSQLIIRIALVHGMTGEAGHFATLKTRGFNQAVVFTARDANHAIRPKSPVQEFRVLADFFGKAVITWDAGEAYDDVP